MTEAPSVYFPEKSPDLDTIYQNEVIERFYYWPPAITQTSLALNPSGLSSTNPDIYYTYSGVSWQYTTAARQKDGRYRNITLRTISGDPFLFYITTKMTTDDGLHHAGPVSVSGSYYTLTKYNSIEEAETNAVEFTPTMNSGIFTLANTEQARMITLSHRAVASGQSYRLYQFLPRTSIEVDDLSAEVIDVVTLRVSDSIVVSPTIPDKSITGAKILDGTISGVIITPGTITSNEIAAGTITGNKIAANTISGALMTAGTITFDKIASKTLTSGQIADASITGANIVAGTVSGVLITDSAITASKIAAGTITGDKIAANTISGVLITAGTITSDKLQVNQLDAIAANMGTLVINSGVTIGNNGNLYVGSGKFTTLNASGLAFKNPVSQASTSVFPAGSDFSISQVQQYAPDVNSIKFAPYYYDATSGTLQLFDYEPPRYTTIIGQRQYYEPGITLNQAGNYSTFSIDSGWLPSESGKAYYVPSAKNNVYITSKSTGLSTLSLSTQTINASGSITMNGNQITISGTGSARSLNLATPTKVTSADFSVRQLTPLVPGFPPLETNLFAVTSGQATFNVPVVFSSNISLAASNTQNQNFPANTQTIFQWRTFSINQRVSTTGSPVTGFSVPEEGWYMIGLAIWWTGSPSVVYSIANGYYFTDVLGYTTVQNASVSNLIYLGPANTFFYVYCQPNITTTSNYIYNRPALYIKKVQ